jgi:hypothetical protein
MASREHEMSKVKIPQDKKRLSLLKDRRNSYGENSKSSRKNIPLSKQRSSQNQRSQRNKLNALITNQIDEDFSSEIESTMINAYRHKRLKGFKKVPDIRLNDHIKRKLERRP